MIAALYVETGGTYFGVPGVDPWDAARDARAYNGPWPVVAHPPCSRWCQLAGIVQARYGYRIGDDGGCFAAALEAVRRFRGVLEHPAYSKAWPAFGLQKPSRDGGWTDADAYGGRTCYVEQAQYGHPARKGTWLYAVLRGDPPALRWGRTPTDKIKAAVSWTQNRKWAGSTLPRVGKAKAARTPLEFRDELLRMASQ